VHDTSAQILRHLREHGGQKPQQIAAALDMKPESVRQTLRRMEKRGQLTNDGSGTYHASSYQTGE
jgi:DNA-binding IclR family transcriptional regulator